MASSKMSGFFILLFCLIYCVNAGVVQSKVSEVHEEISSQITSCATLISIVWEMLQPRIPEEIHYMAWIHSSSSNSSTYINCGGAIISNRHILTSASCIGDLKDEDKKKVTAALGNVKSGIFRRIHEAPIERIIIHPDYNHESSYNDLAILRTKKKIVFSKNVAAIGLPTVDIRNQYRFCSVLVPVWDMTNVNEKVCHDSRVLQYIRLRSRTVWNVGSGQSYQNGIFNTSVDEPQLPTLMGSPLIEDDVLIGIVFKRDNSSSTESIEMNINVYEYNEWIQLEMDIDFQSIQRKVRMFPFW